MKPVICFETIKKQTFLKETQHEFCKDKSYFTKILGFFESDNKYIDEDELYTWTSKKYLL